MILTDLELFLQLACKSVARRIFVTSIETLQAGSAQNGDLDVTIRNGRAEGLTEEERLFEEHRENYIGIFKVRQE